METFQTIINYNPEVEFTYRDITFQFSENLREETEETGVNPVSQKWSVEISGLIPKVKQAKDFIDSHLGTKRFQWTAPTGETLFVRCGESSLTFNTTVTAQLTLVFEQVFVP